MLPKKKIMYILLTGSGCWVHYKRPFPLRGLQFDLLTKSEWPYLIILFNTLIGTILVIPAISKNKHGKVSQRLLWFFFCCCLFFETENCPNGKTFTWGRNKENILPRHLIFSLFLYVHLIHIFFLIWYFTHFSVNCHKFCLVLK